MRRLVIELYGRELEGHFKGTAFEYMRSMEIVHFLKWNQDENAGIWRIAPKDSGVEVEDCLKDDKATKEVQVLEHEDSKGGGSSYLIFLRRRTKPGAFLGFGTRPGGGYLYGPIGFKDGRITFTLVGTQKQIKDILEGAERRGFQYKIVSLTDADFAEDSLLNLLTDKQRRALVMAYRLGYFDVPKKLNSDQLGTHLHLTGSTVVEHLSKAEHRILAEIIDKQQNKDFLRA